MNTNTLPKLSLEAIEQACGAYISQHMAQDSAHDLAHIKRVVVSARQLANAEGADPFIVVPAAWLHDLVNLPKNHPERHLASGMAAEQASVFLSELGYADGALKAIKHSITAHSYSAAVVPETVEAKVVQDADRLDAIGAIGVARCMMVGGQLGRELYQTLDPFCDDRSPDDTTFSIDHFYNKLLCLADSFQTQAGKAEAKRRTAFMETFLDQLRSEIV